MISLQGAKGFYHQVFISASIFWFFIRRSKTANLVRNLVYIILVVAPSITVIWASYSVPIASRNSDVQKWTAKRSCSLGVQKKDGKKVMELRDFFSILFCPPLKSATKKGCEKVAGAILDGKRTAKPLEALRILLHRAVHKNFKIL